MNMSDNCQTLIQFRTVLVTHHPLFPVKQALRHWFRQSKVCQTLPTKAAHFACHQLQQGLLLSPSSYWCWDWPACLLASQSPSWAKAWSKKFTSRKVPEIVVTELSFLIISSYQKSEELVKIFRHHDSRNAWLAKQTDRGNDASKSQHYSDRDEDMDSRWPNT